MLFEENKHYVVVDLNHMVARSKYVSVKSSKVDRVGLSLHILLQTIKKVSQLFKPDYIAFALDSGRSWRYEIFSEYKLSRRLKEAKKSPEEKEFDLLVREAVEDFVNFLENNTYSAVMKGQYLEADDLIATFARLHKDSRVTVVSSDSDFVQLLRISPNIQIYCGIKDVLYTRKGVFSGVRLDKPVPFLVEGTGKVKILKQGPVKKPDEDWYEWAQFLKIVRGDIGDGIFGIMPGMRTNYLRKVFDDRHVKQYDWNNFMNQVIKEDDGSEVTVKEKFEHNRLLVDIVDLPDDVLDMAKSAIAKSLNKEHVKLRNLGVNFFKFCNRYKLKTASQNYEKYVALFSKKYPGDLEWISQKD